MLSNAFDSGQKCALALSSSSSWCTLGPNFKSKLFIKTGAHKYDNNNKPVRLIWLNCYVNARPEVYSNWVSISNWSSVVLAAYNRVANVTISSHHLHHKEVHSRFIWQYKFNNPGSIYQKGRQSFNLGFCVGKVRKW